MKEGDNFIWYILFLSLFSLLHSTSHSHTITHKLLQLWHSSSLQLRLNQTINNKKKHFFIYIKHRQKSTWKWFHLGRVEKWLKSASLFSFIIQRKQKMFVFNSNQQQTFFFGNFPDTRNFKFLDYFF